MKYNIKQKIKEKVEDIIISAGDNIIDWAEENGDGWIGAGFFAAGLIAVMLTIGYTSNYNLPSHDYVPQQIQQVERDSSRPQTQSSQLELEVGGLR